MKLILDTTDADNSAQFLSNGGICFAICDTHAGGTWTLQIQSPGDEWVDSSNVLFTSKDVFQFRVPQGLECRFNGGTTGARIYINNIR